jgi:glycosyltransferase involved in cell wall biosynthesis
MPAPRTLRGTPPSEPDITIVVPAWGPYAGPSLAEAVRSLRDQDLPARILVVDNASENRLPALDGVEVIRTPGRLTLGAARNFGLARVTTPYVTFWDADDLMPAGTLRFLRERLASDSGLVAAAAGIFEDEPRIRHRWPPRFAGRLAHRPRLFALCHSVWSLFPTTGGTLIRADAAKQADGFDDADSGEDWVLGVSLTLRGRVELHERPGRIYRRLGPSIWERHSSLRHLLAHARAVRRRLRNDPAASRSTRALLPVLATLQAVVLVVGRPVGRAVRRLKR